MITIPSNGELLVAATSLVVLMICQWLMSGAWLRNRRGQKPEPRPAKSASVRFHQAA